MSEARSGPGVEDQIFEIRAQLAAAKLRLQHATGSDVEPCQKSVDRLEAVYRTLDLIREFRAPAVRFFTNCRLIKEKAGNDPVALSVLAELPGAEMRIGPTGAFTRKR